MNLFPPLARLLAAAALLGLLAGCHSSDSVSEHGPVTVAVATVGRRDLSREVSLQADLRPYQEVELDAKVSGYLKTIAVDFGARVKAGQLLAEIEVPELHDELEQAAATLEKAKAAQANAHLDFTRLAEVDHTHPNLIAQQDLDTAQAQDLAAAAATAAAQADLDRYRTLLSYTRIVAPFAGVITERFVDPGALIRGGGGQPAPIVRLSQNDLLRVDFPVSVADAPSIHEGDGVALRLDGTHSELTARITRFTRRISAATRTMMTEVELPNPDLTLIPGGYATVTLSLDRHSGATAVPIQAVSSGANPTVDVVTADHRIEERPVRIGIQTPEYDEVLAGLEPGDTVVTAGRNALSPGETVNPRPEAATP